VSAILLTGLLSAYALNPTIGTLRIRQEWGQLPQDLTAYEVFLAVEDCSLIGQEATLEIEGQSYDGMIFDCAGVNAYDEGQSWMTTLGIAAEVDYHFWIDHPHLIGAEEARITVHGEGY